MREVHIGSPIWNGDRTETFIGLAHFRLVDDADIPHKGSIKIWVDYKVREKENLVLMWKYPFTIKCADAIKYPPQILNDYKRTQLHIIPTKDLMVYKTKRKRTMTQDDFELLKKASLAIGQNKFKRETE